MVFCESAGCENHQKSGVWTDQDRHSTFLFETPPTRSPVDRPSQIELYWTYGVVTLEVNIRNLSFIRHACFISTELATIISVGITISTSVFWPLILHVATEPKEVDMTRTTVLSEPTAAVSHRCFVILPTVRGRDNLKVLANHEHSC